MKTRIITGLMYTALAIALLVFMEYPGVMSLPIAFFTSIACHELLGVAKCKNKVLTYVSMACAACVPFYIDFNIADYIPFPTTVIVIAYILLLFVIMLKMYDVTKFEHFGLALTGSLLIPWSASIILYIKDLHIVYPQYFQQAQTVFMVLCAFYSAWMSDTWAYFIGSKFGKHKLSPKISPKKSVEGFVAGCLGNTLVCVITYFVCDHFFFYKDTIKLWMVICCALVLSVMSTLGDLTASVIKRNYGEKDFGTFFPGHGGVMDRVDSLLFVLPMFYIILTLALTFAG